MYQTNWSYGQKVASNWKIGPFYLPRQMLGKLNLQPVTHSWSAKLCDANDGPFGRGFGWARCSNVTPLTGDHMGDKKYASLECTLSKMLACMPIIQV